MTTHLGRVAWCKDRLGGFVLSPSPSPQSFEDEDKDEDDSSGDDDDDDDDDDEDENVNSSGNEEMTASQWLALCHLWQKGGVVLGIRVVTYLGGELAYDVLFKRSVFVYKGCSEDFCMFSFLSTLDTLFLYIGLMTT